ncbi:MAG TPA: hypothetical protein PKL08_15350 [Thermoanaerobaculaceae bacterium]|nr:hypothetical protein [Thermoanaerobaculaceae bacterium]
MFEHRKQPLLTPAEFLERVFRHVGVSLAILAGSLLIGVVGYHLLERQPWVDAILNAAMILGGMGPVGELHSTAGKLFAAAYALYSGVVFLVVVGVLFAPIVHRALHRFHLDKADED